MEIDKRPDGDKKIRDWQDPLIIGDLETGRATLGDYQHLPGYCILVYKEEADHLTDLDLPEQTRFLMDMATLGQAVMQACKKLDSGFWRMNYEILGNKFHQVHAHVRARYHWESDKYKRGSVYLYPDRRNPKYATTNEHEYLRSSISEHLEGSKNFSNILPDTGSRLFGEVQTSDQHGKGGGDSLGRGH